MRRPLVAALLGGAGLALLRPPHMVPAETVAAQLDSALGGERRIYRWRLGDIAYRVYGEGAPLVLVHGINAAASAYEMRRNAVPLSASFQVYMPDLLGFGLSDRPKLRYTAQTYVELLSDFLGDVVGTPAHLVASSLSGAYAVRVAAEHPHSVRSLVLICPTGIESLCEQPTPIQRIADLLLGLPILGPRLFAGLAGRTSIRYFLRSLAYHDPSGATAEIVEVYHRGAQRPGARWAPQAFLGGRLNLRIDQSFAEVRQPVLLIWGRQAGATPLDDAPAFLERNPRAVLKVIDNARLVPHDERAETFNALVHDWIKEQQS